ncbi:unnamed protein product, partial [Larinioides sclopetarius]
MRRSHLSLHQLHDLLCRTLDGGTNHSAAIFFSDPPSHPSGRFFSGCRQSAQPCLEVWSIISLMSINQHLGNMVSIVDFKHKGS